MSCHSVWCEGVVGAPVRVECLPHRALPKQPALRLGPPYCPRLHRTVQYPSHVAGLTIAIVIDIWFVAEIVGRHLTIA